MIKKLIKRAMPSLVALFLLFGTFPGGALGLTSVYAAAIAGGTDAAPAAITSSPAAIIIPKSGGAINYYTFTAQKTGNFNVSIDTSDTDYSYSLSSLGSVLINKANQNGSSSLSYDFIKDQVYKIAISSNQAADDTEVTITIGAFSAPGTLKFNPSTVSVDEGDTATLTVTRTGGSDGAVAVNYATANGSATAGSDYTAKNGTLSFTAGETSKTISVDTTDDSDTEPAETFTVTLSSPTGGASLGSPLTATVTIRESDPVSTVTAVSVLPTAPSVVKGGTQSFTATVAGTNSPSQAVTWGVTGGISGTTISTSGGLLTVAAGETAALLTVTATSVQDPGKSCSVTVTVTSPVSTVTSVTISPTSASLAKGSNMTFTAAVAGTNSPSQAITWNVTGNNKSGTSITDGLLKIDASETAASLTVTATSVQDPTKSRSATVTVTTSVSTVTSVTVSPSSVSVERGDTQTFTATVVGTNSPSQTVKWTVIDAKKSGTTISSSGKLTVSASETATSIKVAATSTVNVSKYGTATVKIIAPEVTVTSVTVSPSSATVAKGTTRTFTAKVKGINNPSQAVEWDVWGNDRSGTVINSNGKLTVASNETSELLTITATSKVDDTEYDTVTVKVTKSSSGGSIPNSITSSGGNVTYDISDIILPSDVSAVSVSASAVADTRMKSKVISLVKEKTSRNGTVKIYDLRLLNQNSKTISDYDGRIRVWIKIPTGMSGDLRVYWYDSSFDTLTNMDAVVKDGYLTFETSHLSYYVVTQLSSGEKPAIPETGARLPLIPLALLGISGICGVAVLLNRGKHKQKETD